MGAVNGPMGAVNGPMGAVIGPMGAVNGPMGAVIGPMGAVISIADFRKHPCSDKSGASEACADFFSGVWTTCGKSLGSSRSRTTCSSCISTAVPAPSSRADSGIHSGGHDHGRRFRGPKQRDGPDFLEEPDGLLGLSQRTPIGRRQGADGKDWIRVLGTRLRGL